MRDGVDVASAAHLGEEDGKLGLDLALRLALVQSVSEVGEPVPMLLDDPFANYDDGRLARTMNLISDIAKVNQVLLFTCREDVARAAESVNAPIIRL